MNWSCHWLNDEDANDCGALFWASASQIQFYAFLLRTPPTQVNIIVGRHRFVIVIGDLFYLASVGAAVTF